MANTKSAKKQVRKIEARTVVNRNRRQRIRTFVKKVEAAIASGNKEQAREAFKEAQPEMHRGVTKGVFKLGTISRKLSRLSARIKAMAVNSDTTAAA
jgi:small subunit ribosomal protein S20